MKLATLATAVALSLTPALVHAHEMITDLDGRMVMIHGTPERVALGFYYEDYLAVAGPEGAAKIVSLSRAPWADWRPNQWAAYTKVFPALETLPDFGNADDNTFSVEALIASKPDVAILSTWQTAALGEPGVKQIENAGIAVVAIDYNAQTLERHLLSTRILGAVMGQPERAEQLAAMYEAKTADTVARIANAVPSGKKIYVELAQKGPGEVGNTYGKGMWAGVIDLVGGENIAKGQIENWGPLSPEFVIAAQPDVILLAGSEWKNKPEAVLLGFGETDEAAQPKMAAYAARSGWADLPAVKNREVYGIYHGGNRTLSDFVYARTVAKALYPEAFADVDPAAELVEYYKAWLPVAPDGTFVTKLQ
ncbi:MAG: ABC transporter substrate-binding protein [Rhodobacteraceae bacterium]|uniref:ABC transporter substrate-binding protein n=2 Tax=Albidovulum sp. TaxID=1872424 RepID=UPI001DF85FAB|nr:ABC transporter substrate-binding protein [Paracoccaceae bacterium]HPE26326.1 ABC transporter substrate-binding protein [Albidovulum sp.]MCB2117653.1 ABC transporter substrate-binding protein [Paracoccaceae bacterium]MCB2122033.1 ABC transporter substrate-binding protein [Paracoccaceae bacterium]MCB2142598.1 ABC transporter substrate-binding protein [Paracoccaceae bacterium]